ncbi:MAG: helix-turn-helix domain-containing protein, partial [Bacteroidales bacterium]|nr:helix-turn-helix domain-containing protein [Bacteroidales bacterium]
MNGNIFYNRLLEAIRESNISVNSLAKEFGMTQSKLYKQMTGSVKMTIETLQLICSRLPALSAEWLMRGEGEMWKKDGAAGGQAAGCG